MKKKLRTLLRLFAVFATALCLVVPTLSIASQNRAVINNALGVQTFRVVENENAVSGDSVYYPLAFSSEEALREYTDTLCREVEGEGLVLLTNNGTLPLPAGAKVSCFGQGAVSLNYSSTGSSSAQTSTYADLRQALESKGFQVNGALWTWYQGNGYRRGNSIQGIVKTYRMNEAPWQAVEAACQDSFASYSDAALVVLSRDSGEGFDASIQGSDGEDGSYLSITPEEEALLQQLTQLKQEGVFKSVVVLLNSALPMELDFLFRDEISVDSCLWIGDLGMSGVYGVADAISGDVNPSGCLTDTFCRDNFSSPAMASWKLNPTGLFAQKYDNPNDYALNLTQQYYGVYVEGIYVGYRYYETRYEDYVTGRDGAGAYDYGLDVAFPFGYGLSYTRFETSAFTVKEAENGGFDVSVTVKNTGDRAGKKVVQVYLQKPYDPANGVEIAAVELAGFAKTRLLNPGESETVTIRVEKEQFRCYDAETNQTYILSAGDYFLAAAENAHDAVHHILAAKGYTPETTDGRMTAAGDSALAKMVLHLDQTDADSFSKSVETGRTITNLLDAADLNRYENRGGNSVTYLSRSDWQGTWPAEAVKLIVDNPAMLEDLGCNRPLPQDQTASPVYAAENGLNAAMLRGEPYDSKAWDDLLDQMTYEEQALLITNAAFGTDSIKSVAIPGTKASDGPTGVISSSTATSMPGEGVWAASFNVELIERIGQALAEDAKWNGVDTLYAPGVNIHRTPFGGRANEYFSEDPLLTALAACAEGKGFQSRGVIPTLKHFAFNDEEAARNGISIWLNEQAAREIYLLPFEYAMRPSIGSVYGAMSSFNRVGAVWTGASRALQTDLARGEWDFQGFFITDMAEANGALYMVYDDGIWGGTDLFLGNGSKTALAAWRSSIPFRNRVREAAHRVLYVTVNQSAAMNGVSSSTHLEEVMPWWEIALMALAALLALLSAAALVLWCVTMLKIKQDSA